jgi:hypothetical protein
MLFSQASCNFHPDRPKYLPQHPILRHHHSDSSHSVTDQVLHSYLLMLSYTHSNKPLGSTKYTYLLCSLINYQLFTDCTTELLTWLLMWRPQTEVPWVCPFSIPPTLLFFPPAHFPCFTCSHLARMLALVIRTLVWLF